MAKTSTKSRNILIAFLIVVVLVVSSIGAVFYLLTYDNVTVSGQAVAASILPATNIQTIQFQDSQTGTVTTFHFTTNETRSPTGNYSVILKNGHTYNVYINYIILSSPLKSGFVATFTVNVPAGQTAITKDFMYPNPP